MRGFSLKDFLNRPVRGHRFRASGSVKILKHAAKYRRPGESLVNPTIVELDLDARSGFCFSPDIMIGAFMLESSGL